MAESFFSSLKKERIKEQVYRTRNQARANILGFLAQTAEKVKYAIARWVHEVANHLRMSLRHI